MRKSTWMIVIMASGVLGSQAARAEMGWVPVPGLAAEISVGASDYPWVRDINSYVQYLDQPHIVCSSGLCVWGDRQWVFVGGPVTHVAADLLGYPWAIVNGALTQWPGYSTSGRVHTPWPVNGCIAQYAPGYLASPMGPNGYPYVFGSNQHASLPSTNGLFIARTTFLLSCDHVASKALFQWNWAFNGAVVWLTTPNGVQNFGSGELQISQILQVTLFTDEHSAIQEQWPWVVARMSNGMTTVLTYVQGVGTFRAQPPPMTFFGPLPIKYATDQHVVAGNAVWHWNGDAEGDSGNPVWTLVPGSIPPAGVTISQIAYAGRLVMTGTGAPVGPSHLWMIDTNQHIYQYADIPEPPR